MAFQVSKASTFHEDWCLWLGMGAWESRVDRLRQLNMFPELVEYGIPITRAKPVMNGSVPVPNERKHYVQTEKCEAVCGPSQQGGEGKRFSLPFTTASSTKPSAVLKGRARRRTRGRRDDKEADLSLVTNERVDDEEVKSILHCISLSCRSFFKPLWPYTSTIS